MDNINKKMSHLIKTCVVGIFGILVFTSLGCNTFLNKPEPPTDIKLSNSTVVENLNGATVGSLSTVDPNASDSFYYNILGTDADYFELNETTLKLKPTIRLKQSEKSYLTIQIKVTDSGGKSLTKTFTITVVTS